MNSTSSQSWILGFLVVSDHKSNVDSHCKIIKTIQKSIKKKLFQIVINF